MTTSPQPHTLKSLFGLAFGGITIICVVLTAVAYFIAPTLLPTGQIIAFTSRRMDNTDIFLLDVAHRQVFNLTAHPGFDAHPAWSPDGTRIAFVRVFGNSQLYLANADGTNIHLLTQDTYWHSFPTWSADSQHIIFTSNQNLNNDIYMMNADGGPLRRLTRHPADDYDPSWRP